MGTRATSGTVIEGKYRLERELGAGGMGAVWLATQVMVDRKVAVKLLHPAFLDQQDLQARFEVEARAIGRLNHPNCITLFDFGFSNDLGAFYTVIEYVNGESLDKRLGKSLPLTEVISIIRQVALALDHAHHQGILHRDLKPENVMLAQMTDGSELVKVLDFGIARIVKGDADSEEAQRITKAGEVFGTPAYMSPEQARSTRQLGPPADLYSLGVMFYELVSGALPFFSNSAFDLLMMHVTKPVPEIGRKDIPEDVKRIIMRLLEKDPEKRFQSGKELARALDAIGGLHALPEDLAAPTPTVRVSTPVPTLAHLETPIPGSFPAPAAETSEVPFSRDAHTTSTPQNPTRLYTVAGLMFLTIFVLMGVVLFALNSDPTSADPAEPVADNAGTALPDSATNNLTNQAPVDAIDTNQPDQGPPDQGQHVEEPILDPVQAVAHNQTAAQTNQAVTAEQEPEKPATKPKTRKVRKTERKSTETKPTETKRVIKSLSPDDGTSTKRELPSVR